VPVAHPVILATQGAEIRSIEVPSQPRQIVPKTLSQENLSQKMTGGVAQGVGPEFKPQDCKKKKKKKGAEIVGHVAQWQSTCLLVYTSPWIQYPAPKAKKKTRKSISFRYG
jgi:hypothetical protein